MNNSNEGISSSSITVCFLRNNFSLYDFNYQLKSSASAGKTWAQVVNSSAGNGIPSPFTSLCPYAQAGDCPYAEDCTYVHGDTCEFCGNACLHPTNEEQRKSHTDVSYW